MAETTKSPKLLDQFLKEFTQFPRAITDALMNVSDDEDEKNVIRSYAPLLIDQFSEIASLIDNTASKASLNEQKEVNVLLQTSSALTMTKSAKSLFPSLGSLFGKLGLDELIKAIKKLIDAIFDIFGGMPKWLEDIILIIDEILNLLLGGISMKNINIFSQREQNFLAERRELALLKRAKEGGHNGDEED